MALNPPDVYIEMFNISYWSPIRITDVPTPTTPDEFNRTIDPADFDGDATYWWEVLGYNDTARCASPEDYSLSLVDLNGNIHATITLPVGYPDATGINMGRQRIQFAAPSVSTIFSVRINPVDATKCYPVIGAVRIVIKQTNPTKSMVQVPLQCLGDWGTNYRSYFHRLNNYYHYSNASRTTYDNPASVNDDSDWCWNASIWKYESNELATISKAIVEAVAGSTPALLPGTGSGTFWYWVEVGLSTPSWGIALFDALGNMIAGSDAWGVSDEMINFDVILDLPLIGETLPVTYYPKITIDGGLNWQAYATSWTVDYVPFSGVRWTVNQNPWYVDSFNGDWSGVHFQFNWQYSTGVSLDSIYISLFDRTTNTMVPDTEMVWGANTPVSRKQVEFDPSNLVSGHEYELRYKVLSDGGIGCNIGFEGNLYLWLSPISAMTVWQRIAKGEFADYMGRVFPYVADESRVLLNIPSGAAVYFENSFFAWATDPTLSEFPLLYQLWDVGVTDSGVTGSAVAASDLSWVVEDLIEVMKRRRSAALSLTDGNSYIVDEANFEDYLFQCQAFIVISATATPDGAYCLSTAAISINPETMILSGTGTGENATHWRVVRVSDGAAMVSGTGTSASFSFPAEYGVEYQLQFGSAAPA
jgi:hypothetical protein